MNKTMNVSNESVTASIVGNHEQVSAFLKEKYPDEVFTVIIWTRNEVKEFAKEHDMSITDGEADSVLNDITCNENHYYGQHYDDVYYYIESINKVD